MISAALDGSGIGKHPLLVLPIRPSRLTRPNSPGKTPAFGWRWTSSPSFRRARARP